MASYLQGSGLGLVATIACTFAAGYSDAGSRGDARRSDYGFGGGRDEYGSRYVDCPSTSMYLQAHSSGLSAVL